MGAEIQRTCLLPTEARADHWRLMLEHPTSCIKQVVCWSYRLQYPNGCSGGTLFWEQIAQFRV
jgi:hypothetical protein